jgi:hypothetical protein
MYEFPIMNPFTFDFRIYIADLSTRRPSHIMDICQSNLKFESSLILFSVHCWYPPHPPLSTCLSNTVQNEFTLNSRDHNLQSMKFSYLL